MIRQVDPFHWNFSHIYFFVVVRNHNIIDTSFLEFPYNSWKRLDKGEKTLFISYFFLLIMLKYDTFLKKNLICTIYFSKKTEGIVTSREVLSMRSSEITCQCFIKLFCDSLQNLPYILNMKNPR